jgi:hypothetical protein
MRISLSVVGAVIAACLLAAPASAGLLAGSVSKNLSVQAQSGENFSLQQVQYRRGGRGGWRGGRRGGGDGGAVAAGVIGGLMLGAIIANESQRHQSVDYCIQRFRSYDPNSGTYLGRDGYRHSCP